MESEVALAVNWVESHKPPRWSVLQLRVAQRGGSSRSWDFRAEEEPHYQ